MAWGALDRRLIQKARRKAPRLEQPRLGVSRKASHPLKDSLEHLSLLAICNVILCYGMVWRYGMTWNYGAVWYIMCIFCAVLQCRCSAAGAFLRSRVQCSNLV